MKKMKNIDNNQKDIVAQNKKLCGGSQTSLSLNMKLQKCSK